MIYEFVQPKLITKLVFKLSDELLTFLTFRTSFAIKMFTSIHLKIAMNRTSHNNPMVTILINYLAIVIAVAIKFLGFRYE